ncbi:hypothetical protein L7F22_044778 [Adiantum nelumboides]|nr:hypothetical protein [Adiantum nelumboides]
MASSQDSSLYNIKKLDGTNFPLWKKQIWHILVQKKKLKPIKLKGIKPEDMNEDEWNEMDELALSTIILTLAESVYFNIADEVSAYDAWTKLSGLYEKQSAASQVYWLKKLVDLKMKEGTPMSNHLIEFNTIYSQLLAQGVRFKQFCTSRWSDHSRCRRESTDKRNKQEDNGQRQRNSLGCQR